MPSTHPPRGNNQANLEDPLILVPYEEPPNFWVLVRRVGLAFIVPFIKGMMGVFGATVAYAWMARRGYDYDRIIPRATAVGPYAFMYLVPRFAPRNPAQ